MFPLRDDNPPQRFPILCVVLLAANAAVFVGELCLGQNATLQLFQRAGVIPVLFGGRTPVPEDALWPPLTLLSSTFLHAGWLHLLGNLWFLWVFGQGVEDAAGRLLFLPLYGCCALAAGVLQVVGDPGIATPVVGASGAIAGILGAYVVLFPLARVETLLFLVVYARVIRVPALLFIGLWFAFQLTGLFTPANVAFWAHVGGFVAGSLLGLGIRLHRDRRCPGVMEHRGELLVRLPPSRR